MTLSLYDISVPVYIRGLTNLSILLKKGEAYAAENKISSEDMLDARLIPDMENLIFQVQRVSDSAKGSAVRIGGAEPLVMEDNEKTFAELHARIQNTIEYMEKVDRAGYEGKEDALVLYRVKGEDWPFTGQTFMLQFTIPNFYFHLTTSYGLLRKMGVPVGKLDFLGSDLGK